MPLPFIPEHRNFIEFSNCSFSAFLKVKNIGKLKGFATDSIVMRPLAPVSLAPSAGSFVPFAYVFSFFAFLLYIYMYIHNPYDLAVYGHVFFFIKKRF